MQYHAGYTMRFPRAQRIRRELTITSCLTMSGGLQSHSHFRDHAENIECLDMHAAIRRERKDALAGGTK